MFNFILNNSFFVKRPVLKRLVKMFFIYGSFFLLNAILGTLFLFDALGDTFGVDLETCGGFLICILPQPTFFGLLALIVLTILTGLWFQDFIHCIRQGKILRMFIFLGIVVFSVTGFVIIRPFIHDAIADWKVEARRKDAEYYKREYLEIGEPSSEEQFIYARDNRIMVSGMNGENLRIIKEIPLEENAKISSVSPRGTYYIATTKNQPWKWKGGYGPDGKYYVPKNKNNEQNSPPVVIESSEVRAVSDNAFVMSITNNELLQDELKVCKWSFDEQFLACRYYEDAHGPKQLILFDVTRGNTTHIYNDLSIGGTREDFAWSDTTLDLFYDQYDQNWKIYLIDNIKEMSEGGFTIPPHHVALPYSDSCFGAGAYQNNTIYCATTTKELPGYKALPKNEFLTNKDGLIIAYRAPEENSPQTPIVVTKAPFSFSAGSDDIALHPVDSNYIAVYKTGRTPFLLNLQTGKINRFQMFVITKDKTVFEKDVETENIFYNAYKGTTGLNIFNNAYQGTVPVPYRGVQ